MPRRANSVHYHSGQDADGEGTTEHGTPQALFDRLNAGFGFTLDPAASATNHKCAKFFTQEQNGLAQSWAGETVFCNPPYGRGTTGLRPWLQKAIAEARQPIATRARSLLLVPSRTSEKWWYDYVATQADAVWFLVGRLRFETAPNVASFSSALVLYGFDATPPGQPSHSYLRLTPEERGVTVLSRLSAAAALVTV